MNWLQQKPHSLLGSAQTHRETGGAVVALATFHSYPGALRTGRLALRGSLGLRSVGGD